jgi:cytidylate kinase
VESANVSARLTEGLARAQAHWGSAQAGAGTAITVTLTREAGTLATDVAQEVGKRLGWPVYDRQLLEHIASEKGLRLSILERVDEKPQSWLQKVIDDALGVPSISDVTYARFLVETVLSLSRLGHCILVGRGGGHLLPHERTLRVRLVAPREHRIAVMARRLGLSHDEAARHVDTTDRDRTTFVKTHFFRDPNDVHQYDLLLNTARWSAAECAELIVEAVRRMERHTGRAEGSRQ